MGPAVSSSECEGAMRASRLEFLLDQPKDCAPARSRGRPSAARLVAGGGLSPGPGAARFTRSEVGAEARSDWSL